MIIEQHIINMTNGISNIKTSVISAAIKDARVHVVGDGVSDTHALFDLLHKYYSMHLLQMWGHFEDLSSEQVGDVKSEYYKITASTGETKWLTEYQRLLAKVSV